jgi:hypothetical protein
MLIPERLLQWVKLGPFRHTLDRRYLAPVSLDREDGTGLHAVAIDLDRTRAAIARIAPDVCAGQSGLFPYVVDEQKPGLYLVLVPPSVDAD